MQLRVYYYSMYVPKIMEFSWQKTKLLQLLAGTYSTYVFVNCCNYSRHVTDAVY